MEQTLHLPEKVKKKTQSCCRRSNCADSADLTLVLTRKARNTAPFIISEAKQKRRTKGIVCLARKPTSTRKSTPVDGCTYHGYYPGTLVFVRDAGWYTAARNTASLACWYRGTRIISHLFCFHPDVFVSIVACFATTGWISGK